MTLFWRGLSPDTRMEFWTFKHIIQGDEIFITFFPFFVDIPDNI